MIYDIIIHDIIRHFLTVLIGVATDDQWTVFPKWIRKSRLDAEEIENFYCFALGVFSLKEDIE